MPRSSRFLDFRRLPKPKPEFDVSILLRDDILGSDGRTHRHFETVQEAQQEDATRVPLLRKSKSCAAWQLADRLEGALIAKRDSRARKPVQASSSVKPDPEQ